jgi:fucose permease
MTLPGPGALAVAGLMLLGLAAAPVFPLLTLTTRSTRMVSLQVAASAVGGAALPAALGLVIGAAGARTLAPALLVLGLAMGGLYALLPRRPAYGPPPAYLPPSAHEPPPPVTPPG